jgi:hypothetical protein
MELVQERNNLKEEYTELLHERLIRNCRNDPNQFIQYVLSWGIPDWIPMGKMHIRWQDTLSSNADRVLLLSARDHSKTTQIPIGRVLWELGKNKNLRIKLVCQSDDTAIKRLSAITDNIERNPRLKEVFPDLVPSEKGTWSKTKIYVNRTIISPDPSIEAVGILSTATGGRSDLLIFDDPVDFRNAIEQPALRNTVKEVYNNVWVNILEPNGRIWVVATPWHQDDLLHMLLDNPIYTKIVDKIDDNFTPIWPEKWDRTALMKRKEEIGDRAFARAFKMQALSDEEAIFNEEMIRGCETHDFIYGGKPLVGKATILMGVDLGSARSSKDANYTVIFTGAVIGGKKIPLNITRGKFKSPEFAKIFYDLVKFYNPSYVIIENNASQEAVIQWVREKYGGDISLPPVKGYFTGNQKMSEEVGLPAMAVEMSQKNWILPEFHRISECRCGYCVWLQELKDFPLGKFSDTVMASWLFREAVREFIGNAPRITLLSDDVEDTKELTEQERIDRYIAKLERLATIDDITQKLEIDEDD